MSDELNHPANRRIDRVRDPAYMEGLSALPLDDLRERRDECLAEREYLSLLRRLVQGRAEILQAELTSRGDEIDRGPLVDRLNEILGSEERQGPGRGEAVRIGVPEDEMMLARRRVERLVADAGISDPGSLNDEDLASAVELLTAEEHSVSDARGAVIAALDTVQAELKRRYKDDPSLALR
ncbi:MAG TPA: aerial mycelium formation protein [Actinomycetota bacterium]